MSLRRTLGRFATGVTVVTVGGGKPQGGMTANSFTSVSLEPPLILISVAQRSFTGAMALSRGHFTVNILSEGQEALARRFASPGQFGEALFDGVAWRENSLGDPVLEGGLGYLACRVRAVYEEGDHLLIIGRVEEFQAGEGFNRPLLFFSSRFTRLHGHAEVAEA